VGRPGERAPPPPKKKSGKYFSGNYRVKFGHFVNFLYIYFPAKCIQKNTLPSHVSKINFIPLLVSKLSPN